MTRNPSRPLSPHLTIWKWGPHMVVSILNRLTGGALTLAGLGLLAWWLSALAKGGAAWAAFGEAAGSWVGLVVLVGLTWAFFFHLLAGIRHLVMDVGAGYELKVNRFFSVMTLVGSIFATALIWYLLMGVGR